MFPTTHIETARRVLGYENDMTLLGAVFPDYGSFLGVPRNTCHALSLDLYDFCRDGQYGEAELDFVRASLTHGTCLPGLDYYADEHYHGQTPGFCFQRCRQLVPKVETVCGVSPAIAYWKAHNFIEMGFDVITAERDDTIPSRVQAVLERVNDNFPVSFLASYFTCSEQQIRDMFLRVSTRFCFDGQDASTMARLFIRQLDQMFGLHGDAAGAAELILEARDLIASEYDDFMDEACANICRDLAAYCRW